MDYELMENNKVFLTGVVNSNPTFSHEIFGEGFYVVELKVERLSKNFDIIPVTVSERLLENNFKLNEKVSIRGQFRSYNKAGGGRNHLVLTVFVREVLELDNTINSNIVELTGFVCKTPVYRTTPFNREICDVLLAVNRAYNKSDYLPCIAWGRNARFVKNLDVGKKINIIGRIQSREYQKKLEDDTTQIKTAYEISISKIRTENLESSKTDLNLQLNTTSSEIV